ncbi:MAG: SMC-Scp complex subunit ScpB [Gammaproteobacteria bacterium]|nr:SMC-Scp complex subunit ScpB [Gammaproteobacteria bacterium]MCF6229928.1 SMC-Scp complex subunit ScpB [Gammaproteobacteria bacterium]
MPTASASLKNIIEAMLLAAGQPLSIKRITRLFSDEWQPSEAQVREALATLQQEYQGRGVELKTVATGYRFQVAQEAAPWVSRLWEERPPRYSKALLETLALIAYRQPISRAEIEDIRGVAVSSSIIKTLTEREWVRVAGQREVPGKPALYATTDTFLDYFNLQNADQLPSLMAAQKLDTISDEH